MITNCKNILVLAPHTDDGELGLGGTISRLIEDGKKSDLCGFLHRTAIGSRRFSERYLEDRGQASDPDLGIEPGNLIIYNYEVRKLGYARQEILEELIRLKKVSDFDLVFIPSLHDIHQDHTTIAQEGLRAFKNTNILGYELIWNNLTFNTQCFVRLEERHIDAKVESLKAYKSQGARDYLSKDFIYSLARARGVQAGCTYAEAFEVIRLFL